MRAKRRADGPAQKKAPKPPRTRKQKVLRVVKWAGIACLVMVLLGVGSFVALYQAIDVPDPNAEFQDETTTIVFADGSPIGKLTTQDRDSVTLDEIPENLQNAVVAAENQSFWSDRGIDPKGILRAAFSNAQGGTTQGASTITQQYVKILYLNQDRSYTRKAKEAILSLKIQREQSKKEILEGYLNTIYFGRGAYGVQAAARAYFDKDVKKLNLRESVVLARVLNNPTAYDPANGDDNRDALKSGYDFILNAMTDLDYVSAADAEKAKKKLPKFKKPTVEDSLAGQKGHIITMVKKELERLGYSEDEVVGKGLTITTTLDPAVMAAEEEAVKSQRPEGFKDKQLHVGVASVEPGTGALRGFYGGQDYLQSQINWAVAGGQAGSILKPFALAAGIKDGYSLLDTFYGNSPITIGDVEVENQGNTPYGTVNLIKATEDSINTAFIDLTDSMENGPEKIIKMMNAMGIPPKERTFKNAPGFPNQTPGLEPGITVALGSATVSPINMANAYATIAAGGEYAEPYLVEKIDFPEDSENKDYTHRVKTKRVLDEDIAADVSYAMQQVVQSGSGTAALALGRPAAGKTGTSTSDAGNVVSSWFAGFTPQLASAVVYVRGKGAEPLDDWLPEFFGGTYPAQTWTEAMRLALEGQEELDLPDPVYVDGEAPESGHTYVPPPPPKSNKPDKPDKPDKTEGTIKPGKPDKTPTKDPTTEPPVTPDPPVTSEPPPPPVTSNPPTPTPPTPSCGLAGCETTPPAAPGSQPAGRLR